MFSDTAFVCVVLGCSEEDLQRAGYNSEGAIATSYGFFEERDK